MAKLVEFEFTVGEEESKKETNILDTSYMDGVLHLPDVRLNLDDLGTSKVTLPTLKNPNMIIHSSNAATNVDHAKHESTPKRKPRTLKGMVITLKDKELIEVAHRGNVVAHTPHTMKMVWKGEPSESWKLLVDLIKNDGVIDFVTELGDRKYLEQKKVIHKRWEVLRKKLESKFNVKIKRTRDYTYSRVLDFKAIIWRDAVTPEHEQYQKKIEKDTARTNLYHSVMDDIKTNMFNNPDIVDEENCDEYYDDRNRHLE
tara:strand:+ start:131 stop:901 length:771 start_codon:yes stop_codon:yes gene_type:complete